MGSHIFGFFGVSQMQFFISFTVSKHTRMFLLQVISKVFFIRFEKWVNSCGIVKITCLPKSDYHPSSRLGWVYSAVKETITPGQSFLIFALAKP